MNALENLLFISLALIFGLGGAWLMGYIYAYFAKAKFRAFLKKISADPLINGLLEGARLKNIEISPFGLFLEILEAYRGKRKTVMTAFCFSKKVKVSNKIIKEVLEGKNDGQILNYIPFYLAHEFGHVEIFYTKDPVLIEEITERIEGCGINRSCLYEELLATRIGAKMIKRISGKNIAEVISVDYVSRQLIIQCAKCLSRILEDENKCPRVQELKKMGIARIEKDDEVQIIYSPQILIGGSSFFRRSLKVFPTASSL